MWGMALVRGTLLTLAVGLTAWSVTRAQGEAPGPSRTASRHAMPRAAGLTLQGLPRMQRAAAAARPDATSGAARAAGVAVAPSGGYLLVPVDVSTGERVLGGAWEPAPDGPDPGPILADATGRLTLPMAAVGPWGPGVDDVPRALAQGFHLEGWELAHGAGAQQRLGRRLLAGETALPVTKAGPPGPPYRRVRLLDPTGDPAVGLRVRGAYGWSRTGADGVARVLTRHDGDLAVFDATGAMVERLYVSRDARPDRPPPDATLPRMRAVQLRFAPRGAEGEEGPLEAWLCLPYAYTIWDPHARPLSWKQRLAHAERELQVPAVRVRLDRWQWTLHEALLPVDRDILLGLARPGGDVGARVPVLSDSLRLRVTSDDHVLELGWPLGAPLGAGSR